MLIFISIARVSTQALKLFLMSAVLMTAVTALLSHIAFPWCLNFPIPRIRTRSGDIQWWRSVSDEL